MIWRVFAVVRRLRQPWPGVGGLMPACRAVKACYSVAMADYLSHSATDRIDRALSRIDAAILRRARANDALHKQHLQLRQRVTEALGALDAVIARNEAP